MFLFQLRYIKIAGIIRIIPFILSVFIFSYCEDESAEPRSYPRVTTSPVSNITENGAIFNGEIFSLGTEAITEHGFAWGTIQNPTINGNKVLLGPCEKTGTFSADVSTTLRNGVEYSVRPFIMTAEHIVYGPVVRFKSMGSNAPIITGFEPHAAGWQDTIIIKGKNFSFVPNENVVQLNNTFCQTLGSTDSTLKILVSTTLLDLKSVLSVDLAGKLVVYTKDTLRLMLPVINNIGPKMVHWGDTITVSGSNLQSNKFSMPVSATLGGFACAVIKMENNILKFLVPLELTAIDNAMVLKINNMNFSPSEKTGLLPPVITGIRPKEGKWGTPVTIKGRFHPSASRNIIKIGGYTATTLSSTRDSIRVSVPQLLGERNNLVTNSSIPFTVISADTFRLFRPEIESVSSLSGLSKSEITIKGKYLYSPGVTTTVRFGTAEAIISSINESEINCNVPVMTTNGSVYITVTTGSQKVVYKDPYLVQNPIIKNFYPLTATFDNEVTIEGENLLVSSSNLRVYFNQIYWVKEASVVSASQNKIVVKVPRSCDSIPGKLILYYTSNDLSVYSSANFVLLPPQISSVTPGVITGSQDIKISGLNFHPVLTENKVFFDIYPLKIKSSSVSELIVTLPGYVPRNSNKIVLKIGGYTRSFQIVNNVNSPWLRVPVPGSIPWGIYYVMNYGGIAFSVNGLGYMMDSENGNMISFDPGNQKFTNLGINSQFRGGGFASAVVKDTSYLVTGYLGFFRYDVMSNKWIRIGASPSSQLNGVAFSLNKKLYAGLTYDNNTYKLDNQLRVYDRISQSWIRKRDFPGFSAQYATSYFSINNVGYVLFGDNKFCKYDSDTDTWTQLASFPGPGSGYGRVSFVLDNYGYVGLGRYSSTDGIMDIWKYDHLNNIWIAISSIPGGAVYNAISFVVNNKAYIGLGIDSYSNLFRYLYEFNPNYPLK